MTGGEREGESGRGGVKIGAKEEPMLFNGKETKGDAESTICG